MNTDKFIRVKKGNDFYYYRCSDYSASGIDCFNFMRSDLNRILYSSLPSGSIQIECSGSTTSTTTTSSTTSSTTSQYPCDISFSTVSFVNNTSYPYDYVTQSGYILIDLVPSQYPRLYQFRIMSGTNIIRDWTTPVSSNNFAFKLICANYSIYVRDYNNQSCVREILNVNVPCLTTTSTSTSSTTTSSTTTIPTTSSTSSTTTSSTTTTQPPFSVCGVFANDSDGNIKYYEPSNNTYRIVLNNPNIVTADISYYNNELYLLSDFTLYKINLTNNTSSSFPVTGQRSQNTGLCHDVYGNLYGVADNIVKYIPSGSSYIPSSKIELNTMVFSSGLNSAPSNNRVYAQGDMFYIQGLDAFVVSVYRGSTSSVSFIYIIKADGSGLILRKYDLSGFNDIYSMFVYNNSLYLGSFSLGVYKILNLVTGQLTSASVNLPNSFGATQNPSCGNISTLVDNFSITIPTLTCTNNSLTWQMTLSGGSGIYQYSQDGVTFSNISGNTLSVTYPKGYYYTGLYLYEVYSLYIKDVNTNIVYEVMLNNRNGCTSTTTSSTTTSTTSTTTSSTTTSSTTTTSTTSTTTLPPCQAISSATITGNINVSGGSIESYGVVYTGSPVTNFNWIISGGTIIGSSTNDTITVVWDGGVNTGNVGVNLTNCNGTSFYSLNVNINNNV